MTKLRLRQHADARRWVLTRWRSHPIKADSVSFYAQIPNRREFRHEDLGFVADHVHTQQGAAWRVGHHGVTQDVLWRTETQASRVDDPYHVRDDSRIPSATDARGHFATCDWLRQFLRIAHLDARMKIADHPVAARSARWHDHQG